MVSKIKLHIFVGTMTALFGWYYLVDSLPRSRLIPDYVTRISAAADQAAANGTLATLAVEQPSFYLDNPVVSVRPAEGGYEIVFTQTSKRRCEQIISNAVVKQRASRISTGDKSCDSVSQVVLGMTAPTKS